MWARESTVLRMSRFSETTEWEVVRLEGRVRGSTYE